MFTTPRLPPLASFAAFLASLLLAACASSPGTDSSTTARVVSADAATSSHAQQPAAMHYEVDVARAVLEELESVAIALRAQSPELEVRQEEGALVVEGIGADAAREHLRGVEGIRIGAVEEGLRLDLEDARLARVEDEAVAGTVDALRKRLDALGLDGVRVQRDGARRIEIAVPVSDPATRDGLRRAIEERGLVTFALPATVDLAPYADSVQELKVARVPLPHLEHPRREALREALAPVLTGETTLVYRFRPVYLDDTSRAIVDAENSRWEAYPVQTTPLLTAEEIRDVQVELMVDDQEPRVAVTLDQRGREVLDAFLKAQGERSVLLMVDDTVLSVARFGTTAAAGPQGLFLTDIPGETTADRVTAAEALAAELRRGALPAPLVRVAQPVAGSSDASNP